MSRSLADWRVYPTLRVREAAELVGVCVRTFEQNVLPKLDTREVGRTRLVLTESLIRWLGEKVEEPKAMAAVHASTRRAAARIERKLITVVYNYAYKPPTQFIYSLFLNKCLEAFDCDSSYIYTQSETGDNMTDWFDSGHEPTDQVKVSALGVLVAVLAGAGIAAAGVVLFGMLDGLF